MKLIFTSIFLTLAPFLSQIYSQECYCTLGLTSFNVVLANPTSQTSPVNISWTTNGETSVGKNFYIEKSNDGTNYYVVGSIAYQHPANGIGTYSFVDNCGRPNSTTTTATYRLLSTNIDNNTRLSTSKSVSVSNLTVSICYPCNTLTLTGSSVICAGLSGSYSIGNTSGPVTWQISNSTAATLTIGPTPNDVVITSNITGVLVTLTATVNGCTTSFTKQIALGAVPTGTIQVGPKTPTDIELYVYAVPGATSYNWYKAGVLVANQHGSTVDIPVTCGINYQISTEAVNGCGTSSKTYITVKSNCSYPYFTVSPNPATNEMFVSAIQNNKTQLTEKTPKTFTGIKILNFHGIVKKSWNYNNSNQATVNVSDLSKGVYFLEISDGKNIERQKIIIKK